MSEIEPNPFLTRERPKTFFKYHPTNKYLDELLIEGALWFHPQDDQNDLFDGKFEVCPKFKEGFFKTSIERIRQDIEKNIRKENPEFRLCEHMIEKFLPPEEERMKMFYQVLFNHEWLGWSICCFTEDPLNQVMWGNYADKNKGVCLEFDFSEIPTIQNFIYPVTYTEKLPVVHSMDDILSSTMIKNKDWSYEKEWRIMNKPKGKQLFDKKALKTVIFGAKISDEEICRINKLIAENGYSDVKFKQLNYQVGGVKFERGKSMFETPQY